MATCAWEAEESSQTVTAIMWVSAQKSSFPTREPPQLLSGNSFQVEGFPSRLSITFLDLINDTWLSVHREKVSSPS